MNLPWYLSFQQQGYHDNTAGDGNYNMYRHNQATPHPSTQQFGMQTISHGYDAMMQSQNAAYRNAPNQSASNLGYQQQQQLYYQQQQQIPGVANMPQPMYGPFVNTQPVRITAEQQAMQKQMIEHQLKQQKLLIEQEKEFKRKQYFQEQKERLKAINTKRPQGITNNYQTSSASGTNDQATLTQSQLSFDTMWERTTDSVIGRSHKISKQIDTPYSINTNSNTNATPSNLPIQLSTPAVQMNSAMNILHDSTTATDDFSDFQQAPHSYYESTSSSQSNRTLDDNINNADVSIKNQIAPSSQYPTATEPNPTQEEDEFGDFMTGTSEIVTAIIGFAYPKFSLSYSQKLVYASYHRKYCIISYLRLGTIFIIIEHLNI